MALNSELKMQKRTSKRKFYIVLLVVILLIVIVFWRFTPSEMAMVPIESKPALTVELISATQQKMKRELSADGKIMAWQEAVVGAQLNGLQLAKINVNVGDEVKKGEALARFKTDVLQAELAQANANVAEAEATLVQAAADSARADGLKTSGALSEQQILQYKTAHKAALARVAALKAARNLAATRLEQAEVIAPDDGVISMRNATLGSVANAGQELFRIVLNNRLEWRAEVTAEQLKQVHLGANAVITLADGEQLQGKVRQIAPTLNEKTNSATVYVDLLSNGSARAGMFANGVFALEEREVLIVPATAVVMRDGFMYVLGVNEQHHVVQIKVSIGQRYHEGIEILSGLQVGHRIIANGAEFLKDGDTVTVVK